MHEPQGLRARRAGERVPALAMVRRPVRSAVITVVLLNDIVACTAIHKSWRTSPRGLTVGVQCKLCLFDIYIELLIYLAAQKVAGCPNWSCYRVPAIVKKPYGHRGFDLDLEL
jgi:hypothetical protein